MGNHLASKGVSVMAPLFLGSGVGFELRYFIQRGKLEVGTHCVMNKSTGWFAHLPRPFFGFQPRIIKSSPMVASLVLTLTGRSGFIRYSFRLPTLVLVM